MVLMIAAGLLLRGLYVTYTIDPGFEYRNITYVSLESAFEGYSPADSAALRRRLIADVGALRGVDAVASADQEPLGDDFGPIAIRLPGENASQARYGEQITVTQGYFSVLGLPIVRGRGFTETEVGSRVIGARPVIVSEATARNLWPGGDPIGRTLLSNLDTLQVVGVAADAQVNSIGRIDPYQVYVPGEAGAVLLIKSQTDSAAIASGVRAAVRALDPAIVVTVLPLEANLGWWRGISGTVATLAGGLGVLALALAAVGIFGVVSYSIAARHREIAVRMALT
jgi:hypothetical protein